REPVDVLVVEAPDEHPVVLGELARAAQERLGGHLGPVTGGRPRKMDRIELPGSGAGRIEVELAGVFNSSHNLPYPLRSRSLIRCVSGCRAVARRRATRGPAYAGASSR